jgi:hypothetical protein
MLQVYHVYSAFVFGQVGHQIICAIAQCMGLPLFRRRIAGTSRFFLVSFTNAILARYFSCFTLLARF